MACAGGAHRGARAMTTYKWLLKDRITPMQRTTWPKRVGAWTEKQKPVLCVSGWHGVEFGQITQHIPVEFDAELWEVEVKGAIVRGDDKFAAEQMRLVRLVGVMDERTSRLAACDFAESVLHVYEDKYPGDTRPRDCIAVARRHADGLATREELNTAIADAARAAGAAAATRAARAVEAARAAGALWAARAVEAAEAAWAARAAWGAGAAWTDLDTLLLDRLEGE